MKRAALLYLTVLNGVGYSFVPTFSRRHCGMKASSMVRRSAISDHLPAKMGALADALKIAPSDLARAQALVQLGDQWSQEVEEISAGTGVRVPGCAAAVSVAVSLEPSTSSNSSDLRVQSVRGFADARLSRGLLALVAQGMEGCVISEALAVEVAELSSRAGLLSALTPSRSNGLASLVATVQDLIRSQQQQELGRQDSLAESGENDGTVPSTSESSSGGGSSRDVVAGTLAQNVWSGASPSTLTAAGSSPSEEVAVLLSGGVDSSVALRLAMEHGYKPRCFYLKIWLEDELAHLNNCPWEEDWDYASKVASHCNVPLEAISMQREYFDLVVGHTVVEAARGRTPNPDILCNSRIKFGMFYEHVGQHFSKVVTGHYAKTDIDPNTGLARLLRSCDPVKDQTYFLSKLSQEQVSRAMFPLGDYRKSEVRDLASSFDLPTKDRKDSQGVCFLGKLKWEDFLSHYIPDAPGPVIELETGHIVGQHRGLHFHTVGQRRGIGPVLRATEVHRGPWFVAAKDVASNVLLVTTNSVSAAATSSAALGDSGGESVGSSSGGSGARFSVEDIAWVSGSPPNALQPQRASASSGNGGHSKFEATVQVRHGPTSHAGVLSLKSDGSEGLDVQLEETAGGLAAGQYAAFYDPGNGICLGSGVISENKATWTQQPSPPVGVGVLRKS